MTLRNSLQKSKGIPAQSNSISKRLPAFQKCMRQQQILRYRMKIVFCCLARLSNTKAKNVRILLEGEVLMFLLQGRPSSVHQLLSQRSMLHFLVSSEKAIWTLWKLFDAKSRFSICFFKICLCATETYSI